MSGQSYALRLRFGLLALVGATLAFTPLTLGAAGDLDPSFDGDGKVTTDFGKSEFAHGMAIQRDGKIVVVGTDTEPDPPRYIRDFVLARYLGNGSLDPTFGGGPVRTDFAGASDSAEGVVEQPDGKLVVAGSSSSVPGLQFAVVRYNGDSSLDSTFDGDGKAVVSTGEVGVANAVALQSDGRIVAAGEGGAHGSPNHDFALARLTPAGSLDTSFDGDGIVLTDLPATRTSSLLSASRPTARSSPRGWRFRAGMSCSHATARTEASMPASTATGR